MNSYDRVLTALELNTPDRVPIVEWMIHPAVLARLQPGASEKEFMAAHLDAVTVSQCINEVNCGNGVFIDEWGIKRNRLGQDYGFAFEFPIRNEEDLRKYLPPKPQGEYRLRTLQETVRHYKGEKAIVFGIESVFTTAWALVGFESFLMSVRTDPEFVKKLLDLSFTYHFELAKAAIQAGADIIMCGDDLAYNQGLILSLRDFREFLFPYYRTIVDEVHSRGAYFVKHTDGRIWEIMDSLLELHIDGINPLEPTAGMSLADVKREYGSRICLIGNIDCGDLLCRKPIKCVESVVKETIQIGAPGGGYIISSSNVIHAAVRPENYWTMVQTAKMYGRYKIS